jgi:hypothetical protein
VLRFVFENNHVASFRKILIKDAMVLLNPQLESSEDGLVQLEPPDAQSVKVSPSNTAHSNGAELRVPGA